MLNSKNEILKEVDLGKGYVIGELSKEDFEIFKKIIESQYKKKLLTAYPHKADIIINSEIEDYHTLLFVDHKTLWPKEARTFIESDISLFKNSRLFSDLQKIFGPISITNEDKTRSEEIYWRLVRPNQNNDIGPLHADSWFWALQNGQIDEDFRRLKIWVSIFNQSGVNGLRLITNSHKKSYGFKGEIRDGKNKPVNDPALECDKELILVPTAPGQFILFHDDLIHGGAMGGNKTRVSFEMTLLIRK
jgi:hypothetical protein